MPCVVVHAIMGEVPDELWSQVTQLVAALHHKEVMFTAHTK